ncbi:MAG: hypothetical protein OQL08_06640 [Gammaproteobacteria bacterium]|nr:hypothetical protein [Gammaproteobacteria bacterium]
METFIYTLIMAAITGLTFIAYKHPNGYKKIFNFIYFLNFLIYAVVSAWSGAIYLFWSNINENITEEQINIIEPIFDKLHVPTLETNLIFWGSMIYLLLLSFLPTLLEHENKQNT